MFDFLVDGVDNALSVFTGDIDQQRVAKLIADGLTVAAVAAIFDVGTDVIEAIVEGGQ